MRSLFCVAATALLFFGGGFWAFAAEPSDILRLRNGREILIQPGWEASYSQGSFRFEYTRPRRLACTLPLEDVSEILTSGGTLYENTYVPPPITFSNRIVLDVFGTIIQHAPRYTSRGERR